MTLACLTAQDIVWASPGPGVPPIQPAPAAAARLAIAPFVSDPSRLDLPLHAVTLQEVHAGTNGRLIIHIQDAHANLSGQQSLAKALDDLLGRYDLPVVLVEGGSRDASLDAVRKLAPLKEWKIIARRFLYDGIISGEEYLNLTSERPMKISGAENQDLYDASVKAYAALVDRRKDILHYLYQAKTSLDRLKVRMYPQELKDYERSRLSADSDAAVDFKTGLTALLELVDRAGLQLEDYPSILKLRVLLERERSIDFDRANAEQARLLEAVSGRGDREAVSRFLEQSKRLKASQASQYLLIRDLLRTAEGHRIETELFAELRAYEAYLSEFLDIRLDDLLAETERLEDQVYERLLPDDDARKVRAIDRFLGLLGNAYKLQMSSRDFGTFTFNEKDFPTESWLAFMNRKLADLGFFESLVPTEDHLEAARADFGRFYELVGQRDEAFVDNARRIMDRENVSAAVLVAGGYHTAHLTELLRREGTSYIVLTPVVTDTTDHAKYEELLLSHLRQQEKRLAAKASNDTGPYRAQNVAQTRIPRGLRAEIAAARFARESFAKTSGARFADQRMGHGFSERMTQAARLAAASDSPILEKDGRTDLLRAWRDRTPLGELWAVLGLDAVSSADVVQDEDGGEVREYEVKLETQAASQMITGPLLLRELVDPAAWARLDGRSVKFRVYSHNGLPLAVYPFREDREGEKDSYLDLADYAIDGELLRRVGDPEAASEWKSFAQSRDANRKLLAQHLEAGGMASRLERKWKGARQTPFIYVELNGTTLNVSGVDPSAFLEADQEGEPALTMYDAAKEMLAKEGPSSRAIFVLFPTVYSPADSANDSADSSFFSDLSRKVGSFSFNDGDRLWDMGTGTGIGAWVMHEALRLAGREEELVYRISDINPFAVANARVNLKAAGIETIESAVANVSTDPEGRPAFEGPVRFISVNAPAYPLRPESVRTSDLAETMKKLEDGGANGIRFWNTFIEEIARSLDGAAENPIVTLDGALVAWNARPEFGDDIVLQDLREKLKLHEPSIGSWPGGFPVPSADHPRILYYTENRAETGSYVTYLVDWKQSAPAESRLADAADGTRQRGLPARIHAAAQELKGARLAAADGLTEREREALRSLIQQADRYSSEADDRTDHPLYIYSQLSPETVFSDIKKRLGRYKKEGGLTPDQIANVRRQFAEQYLRPWLARNRRIEDLEKDFEKIKAAAEKAVQIKNPERRHEALKGILLEASDITTLEWELDDPREHSFFENVSIFSSEIAGEMGGLRPALETARRSRYSDSLLKIYDWLAKRLERLSDDRRLQEMEDLRRLAVLMGNEEFFTAMIQGVGPLKSEGEVLDEAMRVRALADVLQKQARIDRDQIDDPEFWKTLMNNLETIYKQLGARLAAGDGADERQGQENLKSAVWSAVMNTDRFREPLDQLYESSESFIQSWNRVMDAMDRVPRHLFVPKDRIADAYRDDSIATLNGQVMPAPSRSAFILTALQLKPEDRFLEIGAGSGHLAAWARQLARESVAVELDPELAAFARSNLEKLRSLPEASGREVLLVQDDGIQYAAQNPGAFDAIVLSAAVKEVPDAVWSALAPGGRLIAPVAGELRLYSKTSEGIITSPYVLIEGESNAYVLLKTTGSRMAETAKRAWQARLLGALQQVNLKAGQLLGFYERHSYGPLFLKRAGKGRIELHLMDVGYSPREVAGAIEEFSKDLRANPDLYAGYTFVAGPTGLASIERLLLRRGFSEMKRKGLRMFLKERFARMALQFYQEDFAAFRRIDGDRLKFFEAKRDDWAAPTPDVEPTGDSVTRRGFVGGGLAVGLSQLLPNRAGAQQPAAKRGPLFDPPALPVPDYPFLVSELARILADPDIDLKIKAGLVRDVMPGLVMQLEQGGIDQKQNLQIVQQLIGDLAFGEAAGLLRKLGSEQAVRRAQSAWSAIVTQSIADAGLPSGAVDNLGRISDAAALLSALTRAGGPAARSQIAKLAAPARSRIPALLRGGAAVEGDIKEHFVAAVEEIVGEGFSPEAGETHWAHWSAIINKLIEDPRTSEKINSELWAFLKGMGAKDPEAVAAMRTLRALAAAAAMRQRPDLDLEWAKEALLSAAINHLSVAPENLRLIQALFPVFLDIADGGGLTDASARAIVRVAVHAVMLQLGATAAPMLVRVALNSRLGLVAQEFAVGAIVELSGEFAEVQTLVAGRVKDIYSRVQARRAARQERFKALWDRIRPDGARLALKVNRRLFLGAVFAGLAWSPRQAAGEDAVGRVEPTPDLRENAHIERLRLMERPNQRQHPWEQEYIRAWRAREVLGGYAGAHNTVSVSRRSFILPQMSDRIVAVLADRWEKFRSLWSLEKSLGGIYGEKVVRSLASYRRALTDSRTRIGSLALGRTYETDEEDTEFWHYGGARVDAVQYSFYVQEQGQVVRRFRRLQDAQAFVKERYAERWNRWMEGKSSAPQPDAKNGFRVNIGGASKSDSDPLGLYIGQFVPAVLVHIPTGRVMGAATMDPVALRDGYMWSPFRPALQIPVDAEAGQVLRDQWNALRGLELGANKDEAKADFAAQAQKFGALGVLDVIEKGGTFYLIASGISNPQTPIVDTLHLNPETGEWDPDLRLLMGSEAASRRSFTVSASDTRIASGLQAPSMLPDYAQANFISQVRPASKAEEQRNAAMMEDIRLFGGGVIGGVLYVSDGSGEIQKSEEKALELHLRLLQEKVNEEGRSQSEEKIRLAVERIREIRRTRSWTDADGRLHAIFEGLVPVAAKADLWEDRVRRRFRGEKIKSVTDQELDAAADESVALHPKPTLGTLLRLRRLVEQRLSAETASKEGPEALLRLVRGMKRFYSDPDVALPPNTLLETVRILDEIRKRAVSEDIQREAGEAALEVGLRPLGPDSDELLSYVEKHAKARNSLNSEVQNRYIGMPEDWNLENYPDRRAEWMNYLRYILFDPTTRSPRPGREGVPVGSEAGGWIAEALRLGPAEAESGSDALLDSDQRILVSLSPDRLMTRGVVSLAVSTSLKPGVRPETRARLVEAVGDMVRRLDLKNASTHKRSEVILLHPVVVEAITALDQMSGLREFDDLKQSIRRTQKRILDHALQALLADEKDTLGVPFLINAWSRVLPVILMHSETGRPRTQPDGLEAALTDSDARLWLEVVTQIMERRMKPAVRSIAGDIPLDVKRDLKRVSEKFKGTDLSDAAQRLAETAGALDGARLASGSVGSFDEDEADGRMSRRGFFRWTALPAVLSVAGPAAEGLAKALVRRNRENPIVGRKVITPEIGSPGVFQIQIPVIFSRRIPVGAEEAAESFSDAGSRLLVSNIDGYQMGVHDSGRLPMDDFILREKMTKVRGNSGPLKLEPHHFYPEENGGYSIRLRVVSLFGAEPAVDLGQPWTPEPERMTLLRGALKGAMWGLLGAVWILAAPQRRNFRDWIDGIDWSVREPYEAPEDDEAWVARLQQILNPDDRASDGARLASRSGFEDELIERLNDLMADILRFPYHESRAAQPLHAKEEERMIKAVVQLALAQREIAASSAVSAYNHLVRAWLNLEYPSTEFISSWARDDDDQDFYEEFQIQLVDIIRSLVSEYPGSVRSEDLEEIRPAAQYLLAETLRAAANLLPKRSNESGTALKLADLVDGFPASTESRRDSSDWRVEVTGVAQKVQKWIKIIEKKPYIVQDPEPARERQAAEKVLNPIFASSEFGRGKKASRKIGKLHGAMSVDNLVPGSPDWIAGDEAGIEAMNVILADRTLIRRLPPARRDRLPSQLRRDLEFLAAREVVNERQLVRLNRTAISHAYGKGVPSWDPEALVKDVVQVSAPEGAQADELITTALANAQHLTVILTAQALTPGGALYGYQAAARELERLLGSDGETAGSAALILSDIRKTQNEFWYDSNRAITHTNKLRTWSYEERRNLYQTADRLLGQIEKSAQEIKALKTTEKSSDQTQNLILEQLQTMIITLRYLSEEGRKERYARTILMGPDRIERAVYDEVLTARIEKLSSLSGGGKPDLRFIEEQNAVASNGTGPVRMVRTFFQDQALTLWRARVGIFLAEHSLNRSVIGRYFPHFIRYGRIDPSRSQEGPDSLSLTAEQLRKMRIYPDQFEHPQGESALYLLEEEPAAERLDDWVQAGAADLQVLNALLAVTAAFKYLHESSFFLAQSKIPLDRIRITGNGGSYEPFFTGILSPISLETDSRVGVDEFKSYMRSIGGSVELPDGRKPARTHLIRIDEAALQDVIRSVSRLLPASSRVKGDLFKLSRQQNVEGIRDYLMRIRSRLSNKEPDGARLAVAGRRLLAGALTLPDKSISAEEADQLWPGMRNAAEGASRYLAGSRLSLAVDGTRRVGLVVPSMERSRTASVVPGPELQFTAGRLVSGARLAGALGRKLDRWLGILARAGDTAIRMQLIANIGDWGQDGVRANAASLGRMVSGQKGGSSVRLITTRVTGLVQPGADENARGYVQRSEVLGQIRKAGREGIYSVVVMSGGAVQELLKDLSAADRAEIEKWIVFSPVGKADSNSPYVNYPAAAGRGTQLAFVKSKAGSPDAVTAADITLSAIGRFFMKGAETFYRSMLTLPPADPAAQQDYYKDLKAAEFRPLNVGRLLDAMRRMIQAVAKAA